MTDDVDNRASLEMDFVLTPILSLMLRGFPRFRRRSEPDIDLDVEDLLDAPSAWHSYGSLKRDGLLAHWVARVTGADLLDAARALPTLLEGKRHRLGEQTREGYDEGDHREMLTDLFEAEIGAFTHWTDMISRDAWKAIANQYGQVDFRVAPAVYLLSQRLPQFGDVTVGCSIGLALENEIDGQSPLVAIGWLRKEARDASILIHSTDGHVFADWAEVPLSRLGRGARPSWPIGEQRQARTELALEMTRWNLVPRLISNVDPDSPFLAVAFEHPAQNVSERTALLQSLAAVNRAAADEFGAVGIECPEVEFLLLRRGRVSRVLRMPSAESDLRSDEGIPPSADQFLNGDELELPLGNWVPREPG